MGEEQKKEQVFVCPQCGKKVINKGIRISVDMDCSNPEFKSKPEDFVLAVANMQASLVCKQCKQILVFDNPQQKLVVPDKKIVIARS